MAKTWLGEKILHLAIVLFIFSLRLVPSTAVNALGNFYENLFEGAKQDGERAKVT